MSTQTLQSYLVGENFTNLLSSIIISELTRLDNTHTSRLQVINVDQFIIVKGVTTYPKPLNISQVLNAGLKKITPKEFKLNVLDLTIYNTPPTKTPIYLSKRYSPTYTTTNQEQNDPYIINQDLSLIMSDQPISSLTLPKEFQNFNIHKGTVPMSVPISDIYFGSHLMSEKLYDFYFKYITHNLFDRGLCSDIEIDFFTDADIHDISWENIKLTVKSHSLIVDESWLVSMILDLFDFSADYIINKWNLNEYDFVNEIITENPPIWKISDKISEMILL